MNNNQNNFNSNPQMTNLNNPQNFQNNSNGFQQNQMGQLNVIPQMNNNFNQNNGLVFNNDNNQNNQFQNHNNNFNNYNQYNNMNNPNTNSGLPKFNSYQNIDENINNNNNQYKDINNNVSTMNTNNINNNFNNVFANQNSTFRDNISDEDYAMLNPQPSNKFINSDFDTTATSLNDLNIHTDVPRIDYANDPKVQTHLKEEQKLKKTIIITGEAKVFLLIIAAMILFIFVMPYIFDTFLDLK